MSATHKKRILIMDDSPLFLEVANTALQEAGYLVQVVNSLEELESAESGASVDLVLMDVQMPDAFGDDIAMIMRAVRGIDVPIYLLSSLDEDLLEDRARDAGIDGFISKHDGLEKLVVRVHAIFHGSEARA